MFFFTFKHDESCVEVIPTLIRLEVDIDLMIGNGESQNKNNYEFI